MLLMHVRTRDCGHVLKSRVTGVCCNGWSSISHVRRRGGRHVCAGTLRGMYSVYPGRRHAICIG